MILLDKIKQLFRKFKSNNQDITKQLKSVGINVNNAEDYSNEKIIHSESDLLIIKYNKNKNNLDLMFDVRTDPAVVGTVISNTSKINWISRINILPSFYVDQENGNLFTGDEAHKKFIEDMSNNIYDMCKQEEMERDFLYNYELSDKYH